VAKNKNKKMQDSFRSKLMEENSNGWLKSKIKKNPDIISIFLKYFFDLPFLKSDAVDNCLTHFHFDYF